MYGRDVILRERDGVRVPPRVPYQMQNRSKQDLEFLDTSEPPSQGDRENLKAPDSRPD